MILFSRPLLGSRNCLRGSILGTLWTVADWQMRTKRPLREPVREEAGPTLKNYITPAGLQRLKDEHRFLLSRERPAVVQVVAWAASNGDRSENADYLYGKRRLGQIDSRIRFLTKRISDHNFGGDDID
jgi:hypothetical protein